MAPARSTTVLSFRGSAQHLFFGRGSGPFSTQMLRDRLAALLVTLAVAGVFVESVAAAVIVFLAVL